LRLIDVQTLSNLLSVKPKTIYDWVYRKYIPFVKIGRLTRFDEHEVKKWLEDKRIKPTKRVST
jgi:excisionase family DNA binding protein